jgi:hypothetical protein
MGFYLWYLIRIKTSKLLILGINFTILKWTKNSIFPKKIRYFSVEGWYKRKAGTSVSKALHKNVQKEPGKKSEMSLENTIFDGLRINIAYQVSGNKQKKFSKKDVSKDLYRIQYFWK